MRKLLFVILLFVSISVIFGCGCDDSSCGYGVADCHPSGCSPLIEQSCSVDITTWYHKTSSDFSYSTLYSKLKYSNQRSFTRASCGSSGDCCKSYTCACDCDEPPCSSTCCCEATDYDCNTETITCREWENCNSPTGCGSSGSCSCNENYCKGWCMHMAETGQIPVYDGPGFAKCGNTLSGDVTFEGKHTKYELKGMSYTASTICTCSWASIRDYYECDSSRIDDSHPCTSGNCAPDFIGGRNYCCPEDMCAHRENGVPIGDSQICYPNGYEMVYAGYKLRCNYGNWNFVVKCGETIYNFPLHFNTNIKYPIMHEFKNSYTILDVEFSGTKDVIAYITPNDPSVNIKIYNTLGNGGNKVVKRGLHDGAIVKFWKDGDGDIYNLTVDCYTPDTKKCDPANPDCWPESYCSQDLSTIADTNPDSYCCSKDKCAYRGSCYSEGHHNLGSFCGRTCADNNWLRSGEPAPCTEDCDCGEDEKCMQTLVNPSKKICCGKEADLYKCAFDENMDCIPSGLKKYYRNGIYKCYNGYWHGDSYVVFSDYTRKIISKNRNSVIYEFDIRGINTADIQNYLLYVYIDGNNPTGTIYLKNSFNNLISTRTISSVGIISFTGSSLTDKFKIEIDANLNDEEFFYVDGASLILYYQ